MFTWSGSRNSHGIDYEKDLAFTLFVAASLEGRQFRLATEMNVAGKFDDAVLILDDRKEVWFFQAKHSQSSDAKIEYKEFFPASLDENSQFSLPMYIQSFLNVLQRSEFKNYEKKFIIFSNKTIDENARAKLGEVMDFKSCAVFDSLEKKVFIRSCEQFVPKTEEIQGLLNKINELPVAIKEAIIELQKSGAVKSILRKYTTPLGSILEKDGAVRFSETFTGNEDDINQQWLWNELQAHFINQIDTTKRLSEVVFNKKIEKRLLQNKSAETSFPRFIEESDLKNFFDGLVMCTEQPDTLSQLRDSITELVVGQWVHEKDRGLFKDRTKFHVIFEKEFEKWHMVTNMEGNQKPYLSSYEGNKCVQMAKAELRRTVQNITEADFSNYVERKLVLQNGQEEQTEDEFTLMLEQSSARNNCYILIGEPGMGKTTFMKKITFALQTDYNRHVYLICLSRLLKNYEPGDDIFTLIKCAISKSIQLLIKESLECCPQQCFILLDGFDEIDISNQYTAIELIKETFCKNNVRVFISGRNHVKETLEKELQVKASNLVPLVEEEQLLFLRNYWDVSSEIDEKDFDRFQRFGKHLLKVLHDSIQSDYFCFTGLPLVVRMLAEVNKKKFEIYWESMNVNINEILDSKDRFSLLRLYENFINISFNILVKKIINEEGYATVDSKVVRFFKNNLENFYRAHQLLAIKQLNIPELRKTLRNNESVKILENMQNFLDDREKSLLINVLNENEVEFTHLSYAEYFLSNFLYEHVSECEATLYNVLKRYHVVRAFFFLMIEENWNKSSLQINTINQICHNDTGIMYLACSEGYELILKELLNHHEAKVLFWSRKGGTLLHAAVTSKRESILKLVLCEHQFGDCTHHDANNKSTKTHEFKVDINTPDSLGALPMHYAVSDGNKPFVKMLAQHGADKNINAQDDEGYTPLHYAARVGDWEMIKILISDYSANANIRDILGKTILHIAAEKSYLNIVTLMIDELSCDVNAQDNEGNTPLHVAVMYSAWEMVKILINKYHADLHIVNKNGQTLIHLVAAEGNMEIVKLLIDYYAADVNAQDVNGNTPLHCAAHAGDCEMVEKLIADYSAKTNIRNILGKTILHIAVEKSYLNIVKILVDKFSSDVNAQDYEGNTPLHLAAEYSTLEMVKLLIDKDSDYKIANKYGKTLLHAAVEGNNKEIVKMVTVDLLFDVNAQDKEGRTPLHYAVAKNQWDRSTSECKDRVTMLLDDYTADVNAQDIDGNTPLYLAAMYNRWEEVQMFIEKYSADFKIANKKGSTLIHLAAKTGHMDVVKMLLDDYDPDVNAQDSKGNTALHHAADMGNWEIVEMLIDKDSKYCADCRIVNKHGLTVTHLAAKGGNMEIVKVLIEDFAVDVNVQDNDGNTLLHIAARNKRWEIVNMLIVTYSANYKIANKQGSILIHLAASGGNIETVKMLIENYVADANAQDNDGNTPLLIAASKKNWEIVKMLIVTYSVDYQIVNIYGTSLIHLAAKAGNTEIVKMLIEDHAANVNVQDNDGNTPPLLAAKYKRWKIVKLLISTYSEDYNISNQCGITLIHLAAKAGIMEIVKLLIEDHAADVNVQDNDGNTPLHYAGENNMWEMVKLLIVNYNAYFNIANKSGQTPSHAAALRGQWDIVEMLLVDHSLDINSPNGSGKTLLHVAAENDNLEALKMLINDHSADINCRDIEGRTPSQVATERGHWKVVDELARAQIKYPSTTLVTEESRPCRFLLRRSQSDLLLTNKHLVARSKSQ
ncbi:hypothetical protein RP20_CCG006166 [Aedes albopictus]|nr:hypothetical protein RP20_CCG006166 [Aedes albopictus]